MNSLRDRSTSTFVWRWEPRLERYVLVAEAGGHPYGSLTRERGITFVGVTSEGSWTFHRTGIIDPRVVVRAEGSDHEVAVLHLTALGDGMLDLAGGGKRPWSLLGFWRQERALLNEDEPLVRVRPGIGGTLTVTVADVARSLWELPILVMLGPYLSLLNADNTATTTAAWIAATATS